MSNELADFVISQFNGQPGIKVELHEEPRSDFFFNLIFGDEMIYLIVRETNRYARQKLAINIARLNKWQKHNSPRSESLSRHIMGINNLPRLAMYWSSDPFIGNKGIQNVLTKNRFEELSKYLHFSNSATEPQRGEDNYDRLIQGSDPFSQTNFQDFSRTQIDFSRDLNFTITPPHPRSQC